MAGRVCRPLSRFSDGRSGLRSHQTGSDRVVGADVSHHGSTAEKAIYLVGNLVLIWGKRHSLYRRIQMILGLKSVSLVGIPLPPSRPSWCILRHLALSSSAVSPGSATPCPCKWWHTDGQRPLACAVAAGCCRTGGTGPCGSACDRPKRSTCPLSSRSGRPELLAFQE